MKQQTPPSSAHAAPSGLRGFFMGLAPVLGLCVLPSLYLFAQNAASSSFSDTFSVLALTLAVGLMAYTALFFLFGRYAQPASLMGVIAMGLFAYFGILHSLSIRLTGSETTYYAYAFSLAVGIAAFVLLFRARRNAVLRVIQLFVSILIGTLVMINALTATRTVLRNKREKTEAVAVAAQANAALPNLYYIVMDEYAPFETMRAYFDTDMSAFRDSLLKRGFAVSTASYNATQMTLYNMANNLNLSDSAVSSEDLETTVHEKSENATIYRALADLGYQLSAISSSRAMFALPQRIIFNNDVVGPITKSGETIGGLLYKQTILYPISQKFLRKIATNSAAAVVMAYMSDAENLPAERGQAVFCYVLSPHVPYTHNADGTLRDNSLWHLPHDVAGYLGQHAYTTHMLERMLDAILSVDRDCIVVLQSDHNYRYSLDDVTLTGVYLPEEEKCRILNAVYYRGEPIAIEGLSGPNTLRLVLERLGANLAQ